MPQTDVGAFSQFLNYGGLGLLAILCLVVLGYNAWSLNALVAKADPRRISAARPLLLGQMALSLVGLLAVGGGGIYLDWMKTEDSKKRMAQILVDPWEDGLEVRHRPIIRIGGKEPGQARPIQVLCSSGEMPTVQIDVERYVKHRIQNSLMAQSLLAPPPSVGR